MTGFEDLPIPSAVIDLDGTVAAINVAATQLLMRPAQQVVGLKAWDLAPGAEHIFQEVVDAARRAPYHGDITIATPVGPRLIHYVATLRTHDGRTVLLLLGYESATRNDGAGDGDSLGLVVGGIAHDFNNQLVSVLAEATAAHEKPDLDPAVSDSLRRIEAAAQRMALLTRQLLSYAGRGRFVTEVIDPDELVREASEELRRIVRSDAQLTVTNSARRIAVLADRQLLREVLVNLVANASESLPDAGGAIRVKSTTSVRDGVTWWNLLVSDEGIGMQRDVVPRIFDPFFTTKKDRHGLGLSAVHGIVRRLGGDIAVDSAPGVGSTFTVCLPTVAGVAPARRARTQSETSVSLRQHTILIADDEPSVRATIRRLLERRGATVVIAADGEEAEQMLAQQTYDLVLLDVMMPKRTGYQLLPIVRQRQPASRVLLMSGYTDTARGTGGEDEPDLFLEKPFTAKQLDEAVDRLLGR